MSRYPHPADMNPDSSDPRSPYYDSSREEWIADRADELLHDYAKDESAVSDELGYFLTIGSGDQLENALLRFYMAADSARSNEALALAATDLYKLLDGRVTAELKGRAETDAELERVQWEADQAEMRGRRAE